MGESRATADGIVANSIVAASMLTAVYHVPASRPITSTSAPITSTSGTGPELQAASKRLKNLGMALR